MQLQINYMRPITVETGTLDCIGEVIHLGKQSAVAEGRLLDRRGKLYAQGTGTFALRSIARPSDE
jgi:uncharacterized protein (TIGR00369 family)